MRMPGRARGPDMPDTAPHAAELAFYFRWCLVPTYRTTTWSTAIGPPHSMGERTCFSRVWCPRLRLYVKAEPRTPHPRETCSFPHRVRWSYCSRPRSGPICGDQTPPEVKCELGRVRRSIRHIGAPCSARHSHGVTGALLPGFRFCGSNSGCQTQLFWRFAAKRDSQPPREVRRISRRP